METVETSISEAPAPVCGTHPILNVFVDAPVRWIRLAPWRIVPAGHILVAQTLGHGVRTAHERRLPAAAQVRAGSAGYDIGATFRALPSSADLR